MQAHSIRRAGKDFTPPNATLARDDDMKHFSTIFLVIGIFVTGCGQNGGEDERAGRAEQSWKFAIEEIEGSVQHRYAMAFKERVEALSEGSIEVTVFPYGQLGTSSQLTELAQLGSIQFAMASPGHLGSVIPEVQLFSLHFVFSDNEAVNRRVLSGNRELHDTLEEAYRRSGLAFVTAFQEGWMAWTANKPILEPDDFRGVKMRTMNSPLLIRAYELYGANPTTLAYSEVYSALQLNMIDAQVNPVFAIEEMSFYEVQTHMMLPRHLPFITTLTANANFLDALSPEDRKMVDDVVDELSEEIFNVQRQLNTGRMEMIRASSDIEIIDLNDSQRAAFRDASLPIRDQYVTLAGDRGEKLLSILLDAIAAEEASMGEGTETK